MICDAIGLFSVPLPKWGIISRFNANLPLSSSGSSLQCLGLIYGALRDKL